MYWVIDVDDCFDDDDDDGDDDGKSAESLFVKNFVNLFVQD